MLNTRDWKYFTCYWYRGYANSSHHIRHADLNYFKKALAGSHENNHWHHQCQTLQLFFSYYSKTCTTTGTVGAKDGSFEFLPNFCFIFAVFLLYFVNYFWILLSSLFIHVWYQRCTIRTLVKKNLMENHHLYLIPVSSGIRLNVAQLLWLCGRLYTV